MSLSEFYASKRQSFDTKPLSPLWKPAGAEAARVRGGALQLNEEEYMAWFNDTRPILEDWCQDAFEEAWANNFWFTGEYLPTIPLIIRTESGQVMKIPRQLAPLAVNYMNYLTNKRVSELSIYKPVHDTVPEDDSTDSDRMTARVVKKLVERIKRMNRLDDFFNTTEKFNMVHGFVYAEVDWNPRVGDRIKKGSIEREGATEVKLKPCWHVLPWRKRAWDEVPCVIEVDEILHIDEARAKYSDQTLQPYNQRSLFTFASPFVEEIAPDEVVIWRTIYRPDEYLPFGAVVKNTHEKVIDMEVKTYPWSHEELPLEMYTDIDVPSRFFPMSFYQNLKPMQHTYNNLSGLLKRYIFTLGHPKIAHQRGSVNTKSLGNSPALVGFKPGSTPPFIMQVKSIGPDPFNFRNEIKSEMIAFSDTHQIGLGNLPPNTRSGVMISRLREIENQQRGPQIDKRNGFMGRVLLKSASVDADHVPLTSDAHIARLVGKDLIPDVKNLAETNVSAQYRLIIVNSSGFSSEMTGRIDEIAAIEGDAKLPLTPQEKRDIIGGALREKHYDVITAGKFTMEAEIEMMDDGRTPPPPRETDDLVTHWTTLYINMQSMSHRRLPDKIRKIKENRLLLIEGLIEEMLQKNSDGVFAEKVKLLDGYPRLYNLSKDPSAAVPPAPSAAPPGGAPMMPPPPPPSAAPASPPSAGSAMSTVNQMNGGPQ